MTIEVTPNPSWVPELEVALEPHRAAILDTSVINDAAANRLDERRVKEFLVRIYPVIRDFPGWLGVLLERSPEYGRPFFEENIRVERRHDSMWRAMGDGFGVPKDRFRELNGMIPTVARFHDYLTRMCGGAAFGCAVSATNYAVEGVAQRISQKALQGLSQNSRLGPKGRWWLEEHAKYDDEHPLHALEIMKRRVAEGERPADLQAAAVESLYLMRDALEASYQ